MRIYKGVAMTETEVIIKDMDKFERRHPGMELEKMNDASINNVLMEAVRNKYDPAFIEKMLDLQERHEKNEARKAYHEAMSQFKANAPEIEKDKTVSYKAGGSTVSYKHATLANVTNKINAALGKFGLSAAWETKQDNGSITVTCTVTHKLGHSESTSLIAAPDVSGSKNPIQAIGSTISYLERYTLLALTGLATSDMDDDGKSIKEYINDDQVIEIQDLISETKADKAKFLKYFKAESIDMLLASQYDIALSMLRNKK